MKMMLSLSSFFPVDSQSIPHCVFQADGRSSSVLRKSWKRDTTGIGITVEDVDAIYAHLQTLMPQYQIRLSGPPKEHSWGEKSFLLFDPDGNRWEITQSPVSDGMLVEKLIKS